MWEDCRYMTAHQHPREHSRYRLEVPVLLSWKDTQGTRQQEFGLTRDLSVRGAFVFAASPPVLDANIKLKAFLRPGGQALPVRMFGQGKVVRVEPASGSVHTGFAVSGRRFVFRRWAED